MFHTFYIPTTVLVPPPSPSSSQPTPTHNSEWARPLMGNKQSLARIVEADPSIVYKTSQCIIYCCNIEHENSNRMISQHNVIAKDN